MNYCISIWTEYICFLVYFVIQEGEFFCIVWYNVKRRKREGEEKERERNSLSGEYGIVIFKFNKDHLLFILTFLSQYTCNAHLHTCTMWVHKNRYRHEHKNSQKTDLSYLSQSLSACLIAYEPQYSKQLFT